MSYLSRREVDELKPSIDKAVYKLLGTNDSSVVNTAVHCLDSGYDKRKTSDKLGSYLDSKKASKLAEKLFDLVEDYKAAHRSKKRSYDEPRDRDIKRPKPSRFDDKDSKYDDRSRSKPPDPEKKEDDRKMFAPPHKKNVNISNISIPTPSIYGIPMGLLNRGDADKARKIAQLQAQIKSKLSSGILANVIQIPAVPTKPTPLILDEDGRTVDRSGKAVQLTHVVPTLKANIRALKREQFKTQPEKSGEDNSETRFVDNRIGIKPAIRNKRVLRFHEPGKFQQLAERLRMKVSFYLLF